MAIIGTVKLENGLEIEDAYLKVIKADLRYVEQYREWYMAYTVAVYANKVARITPSLSKGIRISLLICDSFCEYK